MAVRALRYLAGNGQRTSDDIAEAVGSTAKFVPHVMSPLVAAGWVRSTRGPNGGYRLQGEAAMASVLDVIEAVEGPTANGQCVLQGTPCPAQEQCALHDAWTKARDALVDELDGVPVLKEGQHGDHTGTA